MRQLTAILLTTILIAISAGAQEVSKLDSTSISPALRSDIAKNPLRPADTSSPRATLQSFVDNMNRAHRVLMAAHRQNTEASGIFTPNSVKQMAREAEDLFERGVYCLDLSKVPTVLKKGVAYDRALQLKEILDRIELPPLGLIPDADAVEKDAEENKYPKLFRWRVPKTDIVLARVEDGPREGEHLFTPQTVARVNEFYGEVRDLPYKTDAYTSDGFFEFYNNTPGWLMPPKWGDWLPAWSNRMYLSQTIWQWFSWGMLLLLWLLFVIAVYRSLLSRPVSLSPATRFWRRALFCLVTIVALNAVRIIFDDHVNITGSVFIYTRFVLAPVWWSLMGAAVFSVAMGLAETIIASPKIDPEGTQGSYFRALFGVTGFVAGVAVLIFGLSRLGVSMIPLVTGLGIGGLAIALAARPTLEGIISSFTIFADDPYRVGQRVNVMGHNGWVESIGLRSTRIRLLNGHVTSIPNEKMAASEVENIGRRPFIRRIFNVTITYDTPPEKINRAVDILREILAVPGAPAPEASDAGANVPGTTTKKSEAKHPSHPNEAISQPDFPPRVYFNDLNADSLNIYVSYWYHPPEYWEYMEHAHSVNVQIMERFNAEGIDFAFPTQTLHLAGDEKHPLKVGQRQIAEEESV